MKRHPAFVVALVLALVLSVAPIPWLWLLIVAVVLGGAAAVIDLVWQARR